MIERSFELQPDEDVVVRVDEVGSGPPMVFIHGLVGVNSHWLPTARALAPRTRCLLVETPLLQLRGRHCNVEGVADILSRTISQLTDQPAIVVGSSFGGHVALRIALERPELCRALVLTGASGLYEKSYDEELEQTVLNKPKREVQHRPSWEWLRRQIGELFYDPDLAPREDVDRSFAELSHRRCARAMVKLSKSARRDHMGDRLHAITMPTLLLWGRQDIVTPPRVAEEFRALIPDARLHWLDQCGHAPMIEKPQEFTDALVSFLDEIDVRAGAVGSRQEVA